MLRRVNQSETPPGGWRYRAEATGREFGDVNNSKYGLSKIVEEHLRANGHPVPANVEELIEDFTCRQNYGEGCEDDDPLHGPFERFKMTWKVIKAGTEAIGSWLLAGRPKVSQAKADERAAVCVKCAHNVEPSGCAPCQSDSFLKLVSKLAGSSKTIHHDQLQACDRCGCSLRVKCFVPLEHLNKVGTLHALPEWCWIEKERIDD